MIVVKIPCADDQLVGRGIRYKSEAGVFAGRIYPFAGHVELRFVAFGSTRHDDRFAHLNSV